MSIGGLAFAFAFLVLRRMWLRLLPVVAVKEHLFPLALADRCACASELGLQGSYQKSHSVGTPINRAPTEASPVAHERGTRTQRPHDVTTPTTPTTTPRRVGAIPQSHPRLCGTPVAPGKDIHGTPVPDRKGRWSPTRRLPTNDETDLESNVFSQTGAVRHWLSYMEVEQRDDHMADESVENSGIIKKIAQRNETHHPGED